MCSSSRAILFLAGIFIYFWEFNLNYKQNDQNWKLQQQKTWSNLYYQNV